MRLARYTEQQNIWPGWVDALASLLIVVVFIVVVFFMAQVALTRLISGQETELRELNESQIETRSLLENEKRANQKLAEELSLLASQFDTALNVRDQIEAELRAALETNTETEQRANRLQAELKAKESDRARLEEQLALSQQETASVRQTLNLRNSEASALKTQVAQLTGDVEAVQLERKSLKATLETVRSDYARTLASIRKLEEELVGVQNTNTDLRGRLSLAQAEVEDALKLTESRNAEIRALKTDVSTLEGERQSLAVSLAALQAQHAQITLQLEEMTTELLGVQTALEVASTNGDTDTGSLRSEVITLQNEVGDLRSEIVRLSSLLSESERELEQKDVTITSLGDQLNVALANRVEDLTSYRSEFFGRMRTALENEGNIRIVGDRFVFDSAILFESGSFFISNAGHKELEGFTVNLLEITDRIPQDIDWVIRIDGHTDSQPIRVGSRFESNWDLSIQRALSVLKTLSDYGVPENRMVAAGFGQYQPISAGDTPADLALNRRIEIKLDQR